MHKKSSGQGTGVPRREEKFFMDQDKVDTFVSAYGQDAKKQNIVSVLLDWSCVLIEKIQELKEMG